MTIIDDFIRVLQEEYDNRQDPLAWNNGYRSTITKGPDGLSFTSTNSEPNVADDVTTHHVHGTMIQSPWTEDGWITLDEWKCKFKE